MPRLRDYLTRHISLKIEERKFLATLPAYAAFRDQTGFLWPKLGQRLSRLPPATH
jgi:hypothetical protein